ncbi:KdsB CMP-2-keto-3-deoxyoctulosonic acid synthetase [Candidatus Nanopelagicaceae bacterium]
MYKNWDQLVLATCDQEIRDFGESIGFRVINTGSHHTRALDRVAEAVTLLEVAVNDEDIIVCVQGDEPLMQPDMFDAVIAPLLEDSNKAGAILAMHIEDETIWRNPDTVKLVHNEMGKVLYTSRSPIPYAKDGFSADLEAKRIYGIFSFRWKYLKAFTAHPETRLERIESCDSNRILDMSFDQYIAPYPAIESFSVDSPSDIALVEVAMKSDILWPYNGSAKK